MRTCTLMAWILVLVSGVVLADDHGNSPLAASPLEPDASLLTACIEEAGDMDYFLFHATAGRTYRIITSHPTEEMDSILYLIDQDGQGILAVDNDSAGGGDARIVWTCDESGVYFLMVRHAQATTGTGCYGLSAFVVALDDHGNNRLSASPLAAGVEATGFLEEPGDVDVFMIQIEPGYEYTVGLRSAQAGTSVDARVFESASSEPRFTLRSEGGSRTERFTSSAEQTLFVSIEAATSDGTGSYAILVAKEGYADDHGNSAASASPIPTEWTEIHGDLEVAEDVDWFVFSARREAEYGFTLASPQQTRGLRLTLRGPDGQVLQETSAAAAGGSVDFDWRAPETGTYYLEVSSADGTGAYVLYIAFTLQLQVVGSFNPSGYSLDVEVRGTTAYLVVGTKGLLILDVSDPTAPFELGSHSTNGYAQAVAISGTTALVANRSEGVTWIDVSDPSRPLQTGVLDTPGSAQSLSVHQGLVLIADQRGGLQIARLQAGELLAVASVDTQGYPAAVTGLGPYALVALGDAGLQIIDLSEPASPRSVGYLDLTGDASGIAAYGTLAYVATGYRGVRIIDVADAGAPTEVGWISTDGEASSVLISSNTLFVAERTEGLSAYSLVNPLAPQLIARVDTPGEATALAVANGFLYVADRQEGMLIVQLLQ